LPRFGNESSDADKITLGYTPNLLGDLKILRESLDSALKNMQEVRVSLSTSPICSGLDGCRTIDEAMGLKLDSILSQLIKIINLSTPNSFDQNENLRTISSLTQALHEVTATQRTALDILKNNLNLSELIERLLKELEVLQKREAMVKPSVKAAEACTSLQPKDWLYIGGLVVAIAGFLISTSRQLAYKRIDTMLEFHQRFHDILDRKTTSTDSPISKDLDQAEKDREIHNWLHWSHQHLQFSTWRKGLISHATYRFWMSRRVMSGMQYDPEKFGFEDWNDTKEYFEGTHFYNFMNELMSGAQKDTPMIQAREHARITMWRHMHAWSKLKFFNRYSLYPEGFLAWLEGASCSAKGIVFLLVVLIASVSGYMIHWGLSCPGT